MTKAPLYIRSNRFGESMTFLVERFSWTPSPRPAKKYILGTEGNFVSDPDSLDGVPEEDVPQSHEPNVSIPRHVPGLSGLAQFGLEIGKSSIISDRVCVYQSSVFDLDLVLYDTSSI
jgi:hypothetical protein